MDWQTIAERIIQDDREKWDRKMLAEELEVADDKQTIPFWDLALTQFCAKMEIPVRYYRKLPDKLKIMLGNHELEQRRGTRYFIHLEQQPKTSSVDRLRVNG